MIKGLVFDIDNTLAPFDLEEPDDKTIAFIKKALSEGFSICLLSNNSKKRVELYNQKIMVTAIYRAKKPLTIGLKKAMRKMGTNESTTVLIGDQIFTDVLCGNIAGVRTILVEPCSERDEWQIKIKRYFEKSVLKKYKENVEKNANH